MSEYKRLLSCWHKLEHFSIAEPKGKNLININSNHLLPWLEKPIQKPSNSKKTFEYTIYLGVFSSKLIDDFVKDFFEDTSKEDFNKPSEICFASIKLDVEGKYIEDSIGISTLPWALGQLEKQRIKNDDWNEKFENLKEKLSLEISKLFQKTIKNDDNEVEEISIIVNDTDLKNLQLKIENYCKWSIKPKKKIYYKQEEKTIRETDNSNSTQTDILNSFYIRDIETIIGKTKNNNFPTAFKDYLNGNLNKKKDDNRIDLIKKPEFLRKDLHPNNYPKGCWPSDYTLSLMQQFAVNKIFNNLSNDKSTGLFSVNGPPGTGKTTLLRDIIAPIIVKKAQKLAKFSNPEKAFTKAGSYDINGYKYTFYSPDNTLKNLGIVIASSNNSAVENISKELPLKSEISESFSSGIEYFKSVAEHCINENNWGLISTALGNKKNISEFVNNVWFKKEAKKQPIQNLRVFLKENNTTENDWKNIVEKFNLKLKEISIENEKLELYRKQSESISAYNKKYRELTNHLENKNGEFVETKHLTESTKTQKSQLITNKKEILKELEIIKASKPSFFEYWLSKSLRRHYKKSYNTALELYNSINNSVNEKSSLLLQLENKHSTLKSEINSLNKKITDVTNTLKEFESNSIIAKSELKNNFAGFEFWKNIESKKSQESCPWYSEKLKTLQSELFIIALKLNEIFILRANANKKIISNTLSTFFDYLKGGSRLPSHEAKAMWDTFFLVIPVISSTFASVQNMFRDLNEEAIPWLFIDEAGQAVPQAAAGAIWRSKRVVVVGDPFQIEPVVTIPKPITNNIRTYFDLSTEQIHAELSVQSMSDRVNSLGAYINVNNIDEWIGIPLRVHRRCLDPMFTISNKIAYANTMFSSTRIPKDISVNFETSFINCSGQVIGRHFVKEQADIINTILINEINISQELPDIFVITPFSEISNNLKPIITNSFINLRLPGTTSKSIWDWADKHIGTVHTFQGKQADGVILCLGLDDKTKGAASWASKKPNLLNVAITRAKYRFIAIGNRDIWLNQPYFSELKNLEELVYSH